MTARSGLRPSDTARQATCHKRNFAKARESRILSHYTHLHDVRLVVLCLSEGHLFESYLDQRKPGNVTPDGSDSRCRNNLRCRGPVPGRAPHRDLEELPPAFRDQVLFHAVAILLEFDWEVLWKVRCQEPAKSNSAGTAPTPVRAAVHILSELSVHVRGPSIALQCPFELLKPCGELPCCVCRGPQLPDITC